jgi:hypothetical protein
MPTDQTPFGGKVVSLQEIEQRLNELIKRSPQLADAATLLTLPKHHTSFKNALLLEGETRIPGDLVIDTDQKWLKQNKICTIVSFGDLSVERDIINDDEHYWPVFLVDGNLSTCNILKGGMPLLVFGSLNASGYIIPAYNDGPMRVGKDLSALGYVPSCKDRPEGRGHVINGKFSGRMFDARGDFKREDVRRVIVSDVLNYNWLNNHSVLTYGHAGKTIWRDSPLIEHKEPVERIEMPLPNSVDPTSLGTLKTASETYEAIYQKIKAKIEFNPDRYSYPENFAEFVRAHFQHHPQDSVLMLPANTVIDGDLLLDWTEQWAETNAICAIACAGNLSVNGDVLNRVLEDGVMLFVEGDLMVDNLIKGGATVMVLGNVQAKGIVVGEYNDGVMRIGGDLDAVAYFLFDHDGFVRGETRARKNSDDDDQWRDVLVPQLFEDEDDCHPNVGLLWAFQKTGRQIFVG